MTEQLELITILGLGIFTAWQLVEIAKILLGRHAREIGARVMTRIHGLLGKVWH